MTDENKDTTVSGMFRRARLNQIIKGQGKVTDVVGKAKPAETGRARWRVEEPKKS
jgi:hypothetical protein